MQNRQCSSRRYFKYCAIVIAPTVFCGSIEIAITAKDQAAGGIHAVRSTAKGVQRGQSPGRCQTEHRTFAIGSTIVRNTVKRAVTAKNHWRGRTLADTAGGIWVKGI